MCEQTTEQLMAKLDELKAAWFAEIHRGDDMDTGKLRELEQEISDLENEIIALCEDA